MDEGARARLIAGAVATWPADGKTPWPCPVDATHPPMTVVLDESRRVDFRCAACEFRCSATELAHVLQAFSGRRPRVG